MSTVTAAAPPARPGPRPPARRWSRPRGRPGQVAVVLAVALLVSTPVLAVTVTAVGTAGDLRLPHGVGDMVLTTLALLAGVGAGTLVVGVGLAWLVTAYDFPGRRVLGWALVLPLAMPAYVLGFVFLGTFGVSGPSWLPVVDGLAGAVVVLSLTLYPYVYLLARATFAEQARVTGDAARLLGAGPGRTFRRVLLPLARPAVAAGLAVVMMETLTDFATVQYFGVRTVSVGVYLTWKGTFDFASAAQLAMLVLLFAVGVLAGERWLRGGARYDTRGAGGPPRPPRRLTGARAGAAVGACLAALSLGFLLPVAQLAVWGVAGFEPDPRFADYLLSSVAVAALAALACVTLAVVLGHATRMTGGRLVRAGAQLTTFGYAVPGAVVGIGVLLAFAGLDRAVTALGVPGGTGLLATGSVLGVVCAYVVRFLAPAYQAVDAGFARVPAAMTRSALTLGARPGQVLRRVHLPLLRSGLAVATVLVTIDAVKELPLVLLLRPFGFTTVSVWVYQLAAENFWEQAAVPALLIVALAVVPVVVLVRQHRLVDPHGPEVVR